MGLGDHPKTSLLKALFRQSTPSWLKVRGGGGWWWWPRAFYCHLLGLGVVSILDSRFLVLDSIPGSQVPGPKSQSQSLDNFRLRLNDFS